ncbi:MAG TPA: hypothetical protein VJZ68_01500 [Nitrososphaera sp.]|nr:hypothetical protein [Nitrososphaera sp.]
MSSDKTMSTRTVAKATSSEKTDAKSDAKINSSETRFHMANFKPVAAPRRRAGLREDQISISKHSISVPVSVATKLGEKVAILWSDADKAIAVQKSADGGFKLKQIGKNKNTRSIYAKSLIEAKKVKQGRYSTSFDERNQVLIAKVA